jgi:hypothetical protein
MREQPGASKLAAYKTRVFSIRTRKAFLDYLVALEAAVPNEHLARVRMVYGDSWLTSFDTILEVERQRRSETDGTGAAPQGPDQAADLAARGPAAGGAPGVAPPRRTSRYRGRLRINMMLRDPK